MQIWRDFPAAGFLVHGTVLSKYFVLQTYIKSMDKDFVAATIQAIGRCATNIGEVRDTCLNGLVQLLSNRDGKSLNSTYNMIKMQNSLKSTFIVFISLFIFKILMKMIS